MSIFKCSTKLSNSAVEKLEHNGILYNFFNEYIATSDFDTPNNKTVDELWMKFNDTVLLSMRSHKVCKLTGTHSYLPWLTSTIRRKLGNVTNYINNTRFLNHQTHVVEF